MSNKKWIVGFILVCVLVVLGFIFGNEDLKIKMASAGLIALVTGIPMYFISLAKESKKTDTPEIEQTPIDTSEASMVDNHLANTLKETASKNSQPNVIPRRWFMGAKKGIWRRPYNWRRVFEEEETLIRYIDCILHVLYLLLIKRRDPRNETRAFS